MRAPSRGRWTAWLAILADPHRSRRAATAATTAAAPADPVSPAKIPPVRSSANYATTAPPTANPAATVTTATLRHYEEIGLIHARRTTGNQRRYLRRVLRRVTMVRAGQRMGVPLARIATALAELPDDGPTTARDWQRVSAQWQDELQARIDELVALRDAAERCIGCGCLSTERCGLVNPGDVLAAEGPGARRLGE